MSRALAQLGARKVAGAYRLVDGGRYGARVTNVAFTAQDCLGVVSCEPAFASVLGQAIDDAAIDGVLGTVAGDDTVLVALTGTKAASRLRTWLGAPAIAR